MLVRLNKYLSEVGAASRREADRFIAEGRVSVNGRVVREMGFKIDAAADRVELDGRLLRKDDRLVYILLHKPVGVVVTLKDPLGRATVKDLLPVLKTRIYPVGRLDASSSGVLLLTNDGEMAFRLTHPRFGVRKIYLAKVHGIPDEAALNKIRRGVFLEGRKTAPAQAAIVSRSTGHGIVRIEIHEGRKREIRKMLEAVGHRVEELRRTEFAGLTLAGLRPGQWRRLDAGEVDRLRKTAGLR
jgi:pseudouridine synthase